jgi:hypothetical protein
VIHEKVCSKIHACFVRPRRAGLSVGRGLASTQSGPSREEQMACRSDAGKFCAEHIGKPPEMNACLRANKAELSDPCRKVVESRGG